MTKKIKARIQVILLVFVMCFNLVIPAFATEANSFATENDTSNELYPHLDLTSYTADGISDELRESILPDSASNKTISQLNADDLYSITVDNGDGTNRCTNLGYSQNCLMSEYGQAEIYSAIMNGTYTTAFCSKCKQDMQNYIPNHFD